MDGSKKISVRRLGMLQKARLRLNEAIKEIKIFWKNILSVETKDYSFVES